MKSKILLINKPVDWTSHDVINLLRNKLRNKFNIKKIRVGHAGTLDPFAEGLLIVGAGREATKKLDEFKILPKTYEAVIKLGAISDTQDSTGNIKIKNLKIENKNLNKKEIKKVLKTFLGKQLQTPPMYSAKKIKGKRLYKLARQGKEIKRKPVKIEIYKIKLLKYKWPYLKIKVKCSTGTYIRTLAYDIGQKLETGAYCDKLRRIKIGKHKLRKAIKIKEIDKMIKMW